MPVGPYVSGVPYATLADFQASGLPSSAITGKTDADVLLCILNAADEISGSMQSQFKLPLVSVGRDIVQMNVDLASLMVLDAMGESPEGESYKTWEKKAKAVRETLRQVREREYHPPWVTDSASPTGIQPGPQATPLKTGWNPSCFE